MKFSFAKPKTESIALFSYPLDFWYSQKHEVTFIKILGNSIKKITKKISLEVHVTCLIERLIFPKVLEPA